MRIGVNTVFLIPGRVGGSETYLVDTLRYALPLRRDIEWVLFTNVENDTFLRARFGAEPNVGFAALGLRAHNKIMRLAGEQTVLPRACRRRGVDVLWSPGYTAPLRLGVPQVVSVLDMQYCEFPQDFSLPARWALRAIVPRVARRSRTVLTLSAFSREQVVRYTGVGVERVRVIYLGVDPVFGDAPVGADSAARVACWTASEPYVLCVAHTHPHKNVAALIRAFAELRVPAPLRLVLVGVPGRGEGEVIEALRASRLGSRVVRLSGISRPDLVALYRGARVFAFPSLYEGFGLPVLEAMAARVPVVAVRCGPIPEIGGSAIATCDGTPEGLKAALEPLLALGPEDRAAWTERAAQRAAAFTWERTASQTLECLIAAAAPMDGGSPETRSSTFETPP